LLLGSTRASHFRVCLVQSTSNRFFNLPTGPFNLSRFRRCLLRSLSIFQAIIQLRGPLSRARTILLMLFTERSTCHPNPWCCRSSRGSEPGHHLPETVPFSEHEAVGKLLHDPDDDQQGATPRFSSTTDRSCAYIEDLSAFLPFVPYISSLDTTLCKVFYGLQSYSSSTIYNYSST